MPNQDKEKTVKNVSVFKKICGGVGALLGIFVGVFTAGLFGIFIGAMMGGVFGVMFAEMIEDG